MQSDRALHTPSKGLVEMAIMNKVTVDAAALDASILDMLGTAQANSGKAGASLGAVVKSVTIKSLDMAQWAHVMSDTLMTPALRVALASVLQQALAHKVVVGGRVPAQDINLIAGSIAKAKGVRISKDAAYPYTYKSYGSAMGCLWYLTVENGKRNGSDARTQGLVADTNARKALVDTVLTCNL